ncbi:MAG: carboxypeptidase regulatory-like domain-containing protein [Bacteroidetes bacterium]|nr:carboxypeptidase regulatory-like domain-containing protein [Bacteroidota bacterium]
MLHSSIVQYVVVFVAALVLAVDALGQLPSPIEFTSTQHSNDDTTLHVTLSWWAPQTGNPPTSFTVYHSISPNAVLSTFDSVATVLFDPSLPVKGGVYTHTVVCRSTDTNSFMVRGRWNAEEGTNSNIITIYPIDSVLEALRPVFVSTPDTVAWERTEYQYHVRAQSNASAPLVFSLDDNPQGMAIDSVTGTILWNNPVYGSHRVSIRVSVDVDDKRLSAQQTFRLDVNRDPLHCAVLSGIVEFETNVSDTPEGYAYLWRVAADTAGTIDTVAESLYSVRLDRGAFSIAVPAGVYKIRVEGLNLLPEWYSNEADQDSAEAVSIECGEHVATNFLVSRRINPRTVKVSGRIVGEDGQTGLIGGVSFRARDMLNDSIHPNLRTVHATVNSTPFYEVTLQAGVEYAAVASAQQRYGIGDDYYGECWENQHDVANATTLTFSKNTAGIDFVLESRPSVQNGFGGTVTNSTTGLGEDAFLIAYPLQDGANGSNDSVVSRNAISVQTKFDYTFTCRRIQPGVYAVFCIPLDRRIVPGWVTSNGTTSSSWQDARRITVTEAWDTLQYNVSVAPSKDVFGRGRVRGTVARKNGGVVRKEHDTHPQEIDAIGGALVVARNEEGNVIDHSICDANGSFLLTHLPVGKVSITADRIGYTPSTQYIELSPTKSQLLSDFTLTTLTTGVTLSSDNGTVSASIFPNPTMGSATVRFLAPNTVALVRVVSLTGALLSSHVEDVPIGFATVTVNTESLPPGLVYVQVNCGAYGATMPLRVVR